LGRRPRRRNRGSLRMRGRRASRCVAGSCASSLPSLWLRPTRRGHPNGQVRSRESDPRKDVGPQGRGPTADDASCPAPRSHAPPPAEIALTSVAITLSSEEGIHRRLRDSPVPIVKLVGTVKAAPLAPVSDRAWAAVKLRSEFNDREVGKWWCPKRRVDICGQVE